MKIDFKPNGALCLVAETNIEAMALKYWQREYEEHGEALLCVVTDVPVRLPSPE